jgi:hypothetical protein
VRWRLCATPATDPIFRRNMDAFTAVMKGAGWSKGRNGTAFSSNSIRVRQTPANGLNISYSEPKLGGDRPRWSRTWKVDARAGRFDIV